MMRRPFVLLAAILLASPLLAMDHSINFDTENGDGTDCSAMSARFDGTRVPVVTENVPIGNVTSLRVRTENNSGIRVIGSTGRGYSVVACKAVAPGFDASAIRVNVNGNEVSADGPDTEDWMLYFIVQTPPAATLDLDARSGPVSVRDFNGTLTAHTNNGPLSLKNSSGSIDATAGNGPISIKGGSGNVKLTANNGPISVKLDGTSWDGGSFDASAHNGPVSLKLPRGFRSGVVVESRGHGPVSCKAEDCVMARQNLTDDDYNDRPRRIELGSGAQVVHLSTVNGPISIKNLD